MRLLLAAFVVTVIATCATVHAQAPLVRVLSVSHDDGPGQSALVRRALHASSARLRACQERRIAQGVHIEGRLTIALVALPNDGPSRVEVVRRIGPADPALEACLLRVLLGLRLGLEEPSTFGVTLALSAPAPTRPSPTEHADLVRADIAAARAQAQCIVRAASRLERLLAAWERAGPVRRARLAEQITAARAAPAMCGQGILETLRASPPSSGLIGGGCSGCLGARSAGIIGG